MRLCSQALADVKGLDIWVAVRCETLQSLVIKGRCRDAGPHKTIFLVFDVVSRPPETIFLLPSPVMQWHARAALSSVSQGLGFRF